MQLVKSIFSLVAIAIIAASCNNVDFKKTKGGMPYKLFTSKSGKKIEPNSFVKANYKVNFNSKGKDSIVYTTYTGIPSYFQVTTASQPYDLSEILPTLKQGDSVYAVQLVDTFMARSPGMLPPQFKKGDKIETMMKIEDVYKNPEDAQKDEEKQKMAILQKEDVAVKDYLAKHNIKAEKTGTGTYVEILNPGEGVPVENGKYVTVMYKGSTFGGKVFDTNMDPSFKHTEPLGMVVGTGGSIKGFEEGLKTLRKGSKARIYIPSMLAYGAQPPSPAIKPFEHLIFDVNVVDVTDKVPEQKRMMPPYNIDTTRAH